MVNNRIIADIARSHGGKALDRAIDVVLDKVLPVTTPIVSKKQGLLGKLATTALLRVATKSVPGAILVGGAYVAKRLHERHKAHQREQVGK